MCQFVPPKIEALKRKKKVKKLIKALRHELFTMRWAAAQALKEIGDKRAVEPLIAVLLEPDQATSVREAVSQALCEIKDPRAVDPLVTFLPKSWAVKALGKLGDRRANRDFLGDGELQPDARRLLQGQRDLGRRDGDAAGSGVEYGHEGQHQKDRRQRERRDDRRKRV